jgi:hypothetical protein
VCPYYRGRAGDCSDGCACRISLHRPTHCSQMETRFFVAMSRRRCSCSFPQKEHRTAAWCRCIGSSLALVRLTIATCQGERGAYHAGLRDTADELGTTRPGTWVGISVRHAGIRPSFREPPLLGCKSVRFLAVFLVRLVASWQALEAWWSGRCVLPLPTPPARFRQQVRRVTMDRLADRTASAGLTCERRPAEALPGAVLQQGTTSWWQWYARALANRNSGHVPR